MRETSVALNQAALIFYWRGEPDQARRICRHHIGWIQRVFARSPHALFWTLQPYINLGRIAAGLRQVEEALSRFSILRAFEARATVDIGDQLVSASAWEDLSRNHADVHAFLRSVYCVDTVHALFMADRLDQALCFSRENLASLPDEYGWMLREACLQAEARRGRIDELTVVMKWLGKAPTQYGLALIPYEIFRLGCTGQPAAAEDLAVRVSAILDSMDLTGVSPARRLASLLAVARMLGRWGRAEYASAVARAALTAALERGDQRALGHSLALLAVAAPDPQGRVEAEQALGTLRATSDYAEHRLDVASHLSFSPAFERLRNAVSTLLNVDLSAHR